MMWRTIVAIVSIALLVHCQPPPPPPRPVGVPVAWPKPEPRKKPVVAGEKKARGASPEEVNQEPSPVGPGEPARPKPDTPRPHDDEPNPGEAILKSEQAKENATNYVLDPKAQTPVIDKLTVLARNVRRARETMEAHRQANGQYNPDDVRALQQASSILENFRQSQGD